MGALDGHSGIKGATEGGTATVDFQVEQGCSVKLSLVSYSAPSASFDANTAHLQKVHDSKTVTLSGGNHSLNVNVPNCFFQVDFVLGDVIQQLGPAGSDNFYSPQGRLIDAKNAGTHACGGGINASVGTADEELVICHASGANTYTKISIDESAKAAHLAHGDKLVSELGDDCVKDVVTPKPDENEKIAICHKSGANSYTRITIDKDAKQAHLDHGDKMVSDLGDDCVKNEVNNTPDEDEKVSLCHKTGSESNAYVKITISKNALQAHLAHGDKLMTELGADCVKDVAAAPVVDEDISICHKMGANTYTKITIDTDDKQAHLDHGDKLTSDIGTDCVKDEVNNAPNVVNEQVSICHKTDSNTYAKITIDKNTLQAHLEHGDKLMTEIGEDCVKDVAAPVVDEDIAICHKTGANTYTKITIDKDDKQAHLNHGDMLTSDIGTDCVREEANNTNNNASNNNASNPNTGSNSPVIPVTPVNPVAGVNESQGVAGDSAAAPVATTPPAVSVPVQVPSAPAAPVAAPAPAPVEISAPAPAMQQPEAPVSTEPQLIAQQPDQGVLGAAEQNLQVGVAAEQASLPAAVVAEAGQGAMPTALPSAGDEHPLQTLLLIIGLGAVLTSAGFALRQGTGRVR